MFRTDQFIATCAVIIALGTTASAAAPETRRKEDVSSAMVSAPTAGGEIVQTSDLHAFTHIAYIPANADLSTIRIGTVKMVKIATKLRSVSNTRDCDDWPGNTADCVRTRYESLVPALRVTYWYKAPSTATEEPGDAYYTFSVYFRDDEIRPALLRSLSDGKLRRSAAAELFEISTSRPSIQQEVIDELNSTFCDGYYSESSWVHTNPTCEERVTYRQVASLSPYVSVKVDLAPPSLEAAAD